MSEKTPKGIPYRLEEAELVFAPLEEGGHVMDEYHRELGQFLIETVKELRKKVKEQA